MIFDSNVLTSKRELDPVNGFLRVSMSNISKAQVRNYLGREIPDYEKFNLDPNKVYNVLCPKEELEKAAKTFNNLPLTREHIEVDVDDVPKEKIVGSLGDHATVDGKYLKNNLIIYDKKDIDLVLSGKKKELSCGYRYTPIRESGEFDGQHYDFKMTDIIGNHVALVKQGRAGRDVMVADSSKGLLETIKEKIMAVFDSDVVEDAEEKKEEDVEWITVKGNHIPVGKGQSKEEAVKSFIESKKDGNSEKKSVFKSRFSKHTVRRDDPNYKAQLSAAKNDLKEAISAFEKNVKNQEEKFKWIEQQRLDMAKADLEDLEKFEKDSHGSEKEEESSEKDIIESLKNKFPRKSEKKDGALEYKKERLKDVEAVSGRETEFYKAKEKEVDEDIKEAKEYVSSVIKKDTGEYKHGKDYFKHQVEKTKNSYGEGSDYYKRAKLHLDLYNEMINDSAEQDKVGVVMKEFKEGELKSGSGEKVTDPKQAIAIALSEADKVAEDEIPDKQDEPKKAGEESALQQGEEEMAEEVKEEVKTEKKVETPAEEKPVEDACSKDAEIKEESKKEEVVEDKEEKDLKGKEKKAFAEGVDYGEKKEKEEPKKLDSEHESEGAKKADKEEKEEKKEEMAKDSALVMDADALRAEGREQAIADFKCREKARKSVRSIVGDVDIFAFDSAEDIYKFACKEAGMNCDEIANFKDAFAGLQAGKGKLAMDASPVSGSDVECFKDIRLA